MYFSPQRSKSRAFLAMESKNGGQEKHINADKLSRMPVLNLSLELGSMMYKYLR